MFFPLAAYASALVFTALCVLCALVWVRSTSSKRRMLPALPFASLMGHMQWVIGPRAHLLILQAARNHGPVFTLRAGIDRICYVLDGEMLKQLLPHCEEKPTLYQKIVEGAAGMDRNLFSTIILEQAKPRRKAFRHGFSASSLRNREAYVIQMLNELCSMLETKCQVDASQGSTLVDLKDTFMRFTLDVIFKLALDYDLGALRGESEAEALAKASNTITSTVCFSLVGFPALKYATWLPEIREYNKSTKLLRNTCQRVFDDFCKQYNSATEAEKSVLEGTVGFDVMKFHQENPDSAPYSELVNLLIAGHETTTHALVWIFHDLMQHPKVLDRLVEDLDAKFNSEGVEDYLKGNTTIPLLEACIKESLRLHPPVSSVARVVKTSNGKGVDLGDGLYIREGTQVSVNVYALQRWERNWTHPEKYLPERWLESSEEGSKNSSDAAFSGCGQTPNALSFLPFFTGSRNCLGFNLALVEIRSVMKMILRKFTFTPVRVGEDEGESAVTFKPTWARMARVVPRT